MQTGHSGTKSKQPDRRPASGHTKPGLASTGLVALLRVATWEKAERQGDNPEADAQRQSQIPVRRDDGHEADSQRHQQDSGHPDHGSHAPAAHRKKRARRSAGAGPRCGSTRSKR
jgi:hypothetical protein